MIDGLRSTEVKLCTALGVRADFHQRQRDRRLDSSCLDASSAAHVACSAVRAPIERRGHACRERLSEGLSSTNQPQADCEASFPAKCCGVLLSS